jgi:hypothetical protein
MYNLLDEPWIPVLWRDGRVGRVGIRKALAEAGKIRQIAASNPMDNVSLLRFLLAVFQWSKPELDDKERASLDGNSVGIPSEWLGKLDEHEQVFNLLGDGPRFYQDKQLLDEKLNAKQKMWDEKKDKAEKKKTGTQNRKSTKTSRNDRPAKLDDDDFRPIGDLLIEVPTESKVVHFRHVRDKQYGLCPACCAVGIIRFCGWANAYAGGNYTSAINGPTPAYAVPQGSTLLQTLLMNRCPVSISNMPPPWLSSKAPTVDSFNAITALAWRSRKLWLCDPQVAKESCAYCGQLARLIKQHAFTGNWEPLFTPKGQKKGQEKKFWDKDQHLILDEKRDGDDNEDDSEPQSDETLSSAADKKENEKFKALTTLGFPKPGANATAHARFWRRAWRVMLARAEVGENLPTNVIGPAVNKGLYQDATAVKLPTVSDPVIKKMVQEQVDWIFHVTEQLAGILKKSTLNFNSNLKHPHRTAALDALTPELEASLRSGLCQWLDRVDPADPDAKALKAKWEQKLCKVIERIVGCTAVGSPFRRREAQMRAKKELEKVLNPKQKDSANAATSNSDKAKSKRKKKEAGRESN